jgi:hypothetical protein
LFLTSLFGKHLGRTSPVPTILSACDCNFTFARNIMKKLQQLFASVVLSLMLSASTFAGDGLILPWVTPPPPPAAVATNDGAEAEGIISTGRTAPVDPVTEVVLSLLPSVLGLL